MPDIQSLHLALGAMPQKEREDFLGTALSHQPLESRNAILLKLDLEELPANSKVQLVFRMGMYPMAHAFRSGPNHLLQWVIPQVPDHLRTLVYSTSRLITEFQETLGCLQHGRGDFVKVFTLLNPENMLEMVNRFSNEMQNYTQQLRDANGRFNRTGPQRGRPATGPRPAASGQTAPPVMKEQSGKDQEEKGQRDKDQAVKEALASTSAPAPSPAEAETTRKPRKARAKDQASPAEPATAAPDAENAPAETNAGEPAPQAEHQETEPTSDSAPVPDTAADAAVTPSEEALAAFGFDVLALAAEKAGETQPEGESSGDSGK